MEDNISIDNVRSRLLIAGLIELERHGAGDFSLRRVAKEAGVSCAAPYRHFKDKDDLIGSIIEYVLEGWTLLSAQITEIFSDDSKSLVAELVVAGLRFWIANGNFRTVIMASSTLAAGERGALSLFETPIISASKRYADERGISNVDTLSFKLLSMLYGAIILVDEGYESAEKAASSLKETHLAEL